MKGYTRKSILSDNKPKEIDDSFGDLQSLNTMNSSASLIHSSEGKMGGDLYDILNDKSDNNEKIVDVLEKLNKIITSANKEEDIYLDAVSEILQEDDF